MIERLAKSGEDVKDGMDVSLCSLDLESGLLKWSGANNPLWIISEGKLNEFKPDRQPVGDHVCPTPFTGNEIRLNGGEMIYLFTDGYQDQFGGVDGKKFRPKNLKALLLEIAELPVEEQKMKLDARFQQWKGSLEQVDDVCMIGVRWKAV